MKKLPLFGWWRLLLRNSRMFKFVQELKLFFSCAVQNHGSCVSWPHLYMNGGSFKFFIYFQYHSLLVKGDKRCSSSGDSGSCCGIKRKIKVSGLTL